MLKSLTTSRIIIGAIAAAAIYMVLRVSLGIDNTIILLNGAFIGAGISYVIAFRSILLDAVIPKGPYDRVRQMALGMLIVWLAVTAGIAASIYSRSTGALVSYSELTPIERYLAIVGGAVQVTAPDFGLGMFYGIDRRLLVFAIAAGSAVAAIMIVMQT